MKIILTCPECGNSNWLDETDKDGAFECGACGEHVFPEDMCADTIGGKQEGVE